MKRLNTTVASAVFVTFALLFGGCAGSYQARDVDIKKPLLVDPAILEKGTGDQALYRYVNRKADIKQYTKVMIDPVITAKDGELDETEKENYQKLANNAVVYLTRELGKDYTIVKAPEPGTMRIQFAIINADKSKPVRNLTSSVVPFGIGLSLAKYAATGKQSGVGEITAEIKITDAVSGELIAAAIDRRVGGKDVKGIWDTWYNADAALEYWAKRLSFVLCKQRGGTDCQAP